MQEFPGFELILSEDLFMVNHHSSTVRVSAQLVFNDREYYPTQKDFHWVFSDPSITVMDIRGTEIRNVDLNVNLTDLTEVWVEAYYVIKQEEVEGRKRKNVPYSSVKTSSHVHLVDSQETSVSLVFTNITFYELLIDDTSTPLEVDDTIVTECEGGGPGRWCFCNITSIHNNNNGQDLVLCRNATYTFASSNQVYETVILKNYLLSSSSTNRRGTKVEIPFFFGSKWELSVAAGSLEFIPEYKFNGDIILDIEKRSEWDVAVWGLRFVGDMIIGFDTNIDVVTGTEFEIPMKPAIYKPDELVEYRTPILGITLHFGFALEHGLKFATDSAVRLEMGCKFSPHVDIGVSWRDGSWKVFDDFDINPDFKFDIVSGGLCKARMEYIPLKISIKALVDFFLIGTFWKEELQEFLPTLELEIPIKRNIEYSTYMEDNKDGKCQCQVDKYGFHTCPLRGSQYWSISSKISAKVLNIGYEYDILEPLSFLKTDDGCFPDKISKECRFCGDTNSLEGKFDYQCDDEEYCCDAACLGKCIDVSKEKCCGDCGDEEICQAHATCFDNGCCYGDVVGNECGFDHMCCEDTVYHQYYEPVSCGGECCEEISCARDVQNDRYCSYDYCCGNNDACGDDCCERFEYCSNDLKCCRMDEIAVEYKENFFGITKVKCCPQIESSEVCENGECCNGTCTSNGCCPDGTLVLERNCKGKYELICCSGKFKDDYDEQDIYTMDTCGDTCCGLGKSCCRRKMNNCESPGNCCPNGQCMYQMDDSGDVTSFCSTCSNIVNGVHCCDAGLTACLDDSIRPEDYNPYGHLWDQVCCDSDNCLAGGTVNHLYRNGEIYYYFSGIRYCCSKIQVFNAPNGEQVVGCCSPDTSRFSHTPCPGYKRCCQQEHPPLGGIQRINEVCSTRVDGEPICCAFPELDVDGMCCGGGFVCGSKCCYDREGFPSLSECCGSSLTLISSSGNGLHKYDCSNLGYIPDYGPWGSPYFGTDACISKIISYM